MKENSTPKILITDDEPNSLYAIEMLLSPEPYEISFADGGAATLSQFETEPPDVLLLDVMMPDMTGYDVCRRLKGDVRWQHIPIILVTALDRREDIVQGLQAGADEFLTKPVYGPELRARVQSMLRIKQQHDQLQETLQLREDMAKMIVHDMRSPLAALMLYTDLLKHDKGQQGRREYLGQQISSQAHRLNAFVSDLLLLAKMNAGKLSLLTEPVDVAALLDTAKKQYQELANSKKITIAVTAPAQKREFPLDRKLMQRVIDNLLSNAYKFSPENGVIALRLEYGEEVGADQARLRLQVADHGPGIPEEHRERIFNEYEIIEARQRGITQVGLGLAFCKLVVTAHQGRIFVADNVPSGAVFTIEL
jgi:two-component system, sensor histidine kinase and response regulator